MFDYYGLILAKIGDKVKLKNIRDLNIKDETIYTIIEIFDKSIKVKHPSISGYFVFLKKSIREIVNEN